LIGCGSCGTLACPMPKLGPSLALVLHKYETPTPERVESEQQRYHLTQAMTNTYERIAAALLLLSAVAAVVRRTRRVLRRD
jgi:hypothetical protein